MTQFHLYLTILIAIAAINTLLQINRVCRYGRPSSHRKSPAPADFVVIENGSRTLLGPAVFTARGSARVISRGSCGTAMDQSVVTAWHGAQIMALGHSHVEGEEESLTIVFPGATARIKSNAEAIIKRGVKAYVRNGAIVVDQGGSIYMTGDPGVLFGLEPASVVAESGAVINAHSGSEVIVEPSVLVKCAQAKFAVPVRR